MKTKSLSWSDLAKKIVYTGIGGAALARQAVSESKLPRNIVNNLLAGAEKRKDEVLNMLAREVSKFLGKINVSEEIKKALKDLQVTLNASIDFKEKKGKTTPHTTLYSAKVAKK